MQLIRRTAIAILWLGISVAARGSIVSSGSILLPGTVALDLDNGSTSIGDPGLDIFWDMIGGGARAMAALAVGAGIVNIGVTDFNAVTVAQLQALSYGASVDGSDGSNQLVLGDVFAVHTDLGNYSKVLVTNDFTQNFNTIGLQWETDSAQSAVPEPVSSWLVILGIAGISGLRLRRHRHHPFRERKSLGVAQ